MTIQTPLADLAGLATTALAEVAWIVAFDRTTGKAESASDDVAQVLGADGLAHCTFDAMFASAPDAWAQVLAGETVQVAGILPLGQGAFRACAGMLRSGEGRNPPILFIGLPVCQLDGEGSIGLLIHRFEALGKALAICQYGPDGTITAANDVYPWKTTG